MISYLLTQVGVDPRLRGLAKQLLLAVTNAEAVEEAVLVLMTNVAADTAAQVQAAAEKLVLLLQQTSAAQVMTHCTCLLHDFGHDCHTYLAIIP